jgi:membrane protease YdiL (CAAX protease family)
MDGLDLLKKDWNKEEKYPKLTSDDIYRMILKKSSSIVKWIFIISLLEFVFWFGIAFLLKNTSFSGKIENLDLDRVLIPISVISYGVIFYFFYLFYKNYKSISATDNSKVLMENILKTRRTVKYYVIFNLFSIVVGAIVGIYYALNHDPETIIKLQQATVNGNEFKIYLMFIVITVLALIVTIGLLIIFYWLIYGLLLKRLNRNYKELKKLEL